MKIFVLAAAVLLMSGCAVRARWQACMISTASGEIGCMAPQDRDGAEKKALVVNMVGRGEAIAWAQRVQAKAARALPNVSPKVDRRDQ